MSRFYQAARLFAILVELMGHGPGWVLVAAEFAAAAAVAAPLRFRAGARR
ncbi:hypothetical protein ABT061_25420 [Streptosporangium sp. NPDC002544]